MEILPKCIIPWLYLEVFPDGVVTPCCSNTLKLGDIKTTSLEEIWNGNEMNQFRLSLFKEDLPPSCHSCKMVEELGGNSLRKKYNNFFKSSFFNISENTNKDGSLKNIKFKGWDFKISNKCNFKCRMCFEGLSSSFNGKILSNAKDLDINKFVEDNIDHLELIEFGGGETLLMDEQYELLQKLIENGKTDIELWYNTNMSILSYKDKNILDYWSKWNPQKLTVIASIDEIGTRSEYIRKGTKWDTIDKNLKIITAQNFNRSLNITVSCFNIFRLPEIIEYLTDIEYIHKKFNYMNFDLSLVNGGWDSSLSSAILPNEIKEKIKEKLINFTKNYNLKYNVDITQKFIPVINCLSKKNDKKNIREFLLQTIKMDKERKESLIKSIPEFEEILLTWKKKTISHNSPLLE
jgi:radical SAM protein with 4Fe4S-binding SPASM domain